MAPVFLWAIPLPFCRRIDLSACFLNKGLVLLVGNRILADPIGGQINLVLRCFVLWYAFPWQAAHQEWPSPNVDGLGFKRFALNNRTRKLSQKLVVRQTAEEHRNATAGNIAR